MAKPLPKQDDGYSEADPIRLVALRRINGCPQSTLLYLRHNVRFQRNRVNLNAKYFLAVRASIGNPLPAMLKANNYVNTSCGNCGQWLFAVRALTLA